MTISQAIKTPKLIIDKLSVTRANPDRQQVQNKIDALAIYCKQQRYQHRSSDHYAIAATIPVPTSTGLEPCILQLGARDAKTNAYRIEYNPSKLGPDGRAELDTLLLYVFGDGLLEFVLNGKITRLDLAIDLPGITTNDVIVRSSYVRKHGIYSGTTGIPETVYVGKTSGTVAYNKVSSSESDPITRLRIERRLRPNCLRRHLPNIKNPFDKIRVVPTNILMPLVPEPADVYFDSMRIRGIHRALKMLPYQDRLRVAHVVNDPTNTLLPPDICDSWRDSLAVIGLAHPRRLTQSIHRDQANEKYFLSLGVTGRSPPSADSHIAKMVIKAPLELELLRDISPRPKQLDSVTSMTIIAPAAIGIAAHINEDNHNVAPQHPVHR